MLNQHNGGPIIDLKTKEVTAPVSSLAHEFYHVRQDSEDRLYTDGTGNGYSEDLENEALAFEKLVGDRLGIPFREEYNMSQKYWIVNSSSEHGTLTLKTGTTLSQVPICV